MNNKTSKELYNNLQAQCGITVGDTVRITCKAVNYQFGWPTVWASAMDETVGLSGKVTEVDVHHGINVVFADSSIDEWYYPFFILEKVETFEEIPLSKSYTAKIYKDRVEVGCQTISYEVIDQIIKVRQQL